MASTSVAVTVYTVVAMLIFSETLAVAPEVIEGASFTFVTVIATSLVTDDVPFETSTTILYTLFAPLSAGAS